MKAMIRRIYKRWLLVTCLVIPMGFLFSPGADAVVMAYDDSSGVDQNGYTWWYHYDRDFKTEFSMSDTQYPAMTAALGTSSLKLIVSAYNYNQNDYEFRWNSSQPAVVQMKGSYRDGDTVKAVIDPRKTGSSVITGQFYDKNHKSFVGTVYRKTITVTNPKVASTTVNGVWISKKNNSYRLPISGVSFAKSRIKIGIKDNSNLRKEKYTQSGGYYVSAYTSVNTKVIVDVDGKRFYTTVKTAAPVINNRYVYKEDKYVPNVCYCYSNSGSKKKTMKVAGLPSGIKPTFKSGNKKILKVSSKGVVKVKKSGKTTVRIKIGTKTIKQKFYVYKLKKSIRKAISQAKYMRKKNIKYSQKKRMSKGYADCSSFVWKAYKKGKVSLGSKSYAPTASVQAKYLVRKKRILGYKKTKVSKMKPGDLIFYTGAKNGRYKGIYHVAMYLGGNDGIDVNGRFELYTTEKGYIKYMVGRVVK